MKFHETSGNGTDRMFGFGFVLTGAPDRPDMEWIEVARESASPKDFRYKCQASFGWKQGDIYCSNGESLPLEQCSGLFVGELEYVDAKMLPSR